MEIKNGSDILNGFNGDLTVMPLPAGGVSTPPGGDVWQTPDGMVITAPDEQGKQVAAHYITAGGVIVTRRGGLKCGSCKNWLVRDAAYCHQCGSKVAPAAE